MRFSEICGVEGRSEGIGSTGELTMSGRIIHSHSRTLKSLTVNLTEHAQNLYWKLETAVGRNQGSQPVGSHTWRVCRGLETPHSKDGSSSWIDISYRAPAGFLIDINKLILKFVWKGEGSRAEVALRKIRMGRIMAGLLRFATLLPWWRPRGTDRGRDPRSRENTTQATSGIGTVGHSWAQGLTNEFKMDHRSKFIQNIELKFLEENSGNVFVTLT